MSQAPEQQSARVKRATRSNTPLPTVGVKSSWEYGSAGKATLNTQLAESTSGFDQAFGRTRQQSREPAPVARAESRTFRPATGLQASATYASHSPNMQLRVSPQIEEDEQPVEVVPDVPHAHEPWSLTVFLHTVPRYYAQLLRSINLHPMAILAGAGIISFYLLISSIVVALLLGIYAPLPGNIGLQRDNILTAVNNSYTNGLFHNVNLATQSAINLATLHMLRSTTDHIAGVNIRLNETEHGLNQIKAILPDVMVLRRVDGELELPEEFWQAINSRFTKNMNDAAWQHFLAENEEKISTKVAGLVEQNLQHQTITHEFVGKAQLQEAISESSKSVVAEVSAILDETKANLYRDVAAIARQVAGEVVQNSSPQLDVQTITKSHLVSNLNRMMRERNHLSVGLGAVIDPYLTSPTRVYGDFTVVRWLYSFVSRQIAPKRINPPAVALLPWAEAGDCWCARKSSFFPGLAQISIKLGDFVYPETLVIEHIPISGTRHPEAAPKSWEVWADMGTESQARKKAQQIKDTASMVNHFPCTGAAPGQTFICIGTGEYRIYNALYAQQFKLSIFAKALGIKTDRIVFRVMENWGANYTCLYRLHLTGDDSTSARIAFSHDK